mmetsp:Transcript_65794/g.195810  ORF Transcript_65794/g.195810 Transcript_65794/m.195810 type:complete len:561 (-) Transcript_65794:64-1746(-)
MCGASSELRTAGGGHLGSLELDPRRPAQKCAIPGDLVRRVVLVPQLAGNARRPADGPTILLLVALPAGVVAAPCLAAVICLVAADRGGVRHHGAGPIRPVLFLLAPVDAPLALGLAGGPARVLLVAPAGGVPAAPGAAAVLQVLGAGPAKVVQAVPVQVPRPPRREVPGAELAAALPGLVADEDAGLVHPLQEAAEPRGAGARPRRVGVGDGAQLRHHEPLAVPPRPGDGLLQTLVGAAASRLAPAGGARGVPRAPGPGAGEGGVHVLVHVVGQVLRWVAQRCQPRVPRVIAVSQALAPTVRAGPIGRVAPVQARDQDQVPCASPSDRINRGLRPLPPELHHGAVAVLGVPVEVPLDAALEAPVRLVVEPKDHLVVSAPLLRDCRPELGKVAAHHVQAVVLQAKLAVVGVHDHVAAQLRGDQLNDLVDSGHGVQVLRAQLRLQPLPSHRQPEAVSACVVEVPDIAQAGPRVPAIPAAGCIQAEAQEVDADAPHAIPPPVCLRAHPPLDGLVLEVVLMPGGGLEEDVEVSWRRRRLLLRLLLRGLQGLAEGMAGLPHGDIL